MSKWNVPHSPTRGRREPWVRDCSVLWTYVLQDLNLWKTDNNHYNYPEELHEVLNLFYFIFYLKNLRKPYKLFNQSCITGGEHCLVMNNLAWLHPIIKTFFCCGCFWLSLLINFLYLSSTVFRAQKLLGLSNNNELKQTNVSETKTASFPVSVYTGGIRLYHWVKINLTCISLIKYFQREKNSFDLGLQLNLRYISIFM